MTAAALASSTMNWNAMTPISIEQGFDLLTETGRRNAERYIQQEQPDLIVAEWMCDPYSKIRNVNFAKGGLTEAKILDMRKSHAKLVAWIAKQERWQREVNKGHWLGEQPEKCGSWNLRATQEMRRGNYNTVFDMCNADAAGLKDPQANRPIRKRTKLNHTSGILHMRFKD